MVFLTDSHSSRARILLARVYIKKKKKNFGPKSNTRVLNEHYILAWFGLVNTQGGWASEMNPHF